MAGFIDPSNKILRHPEALVRMRCGQRVWPINVEFDVSNVCNLACRNCDFAHAHNGELMDAELAGRIFGELAKGGTKAVTFTGGGEPTCNPHFGNIVTAAHNAGLDIGLYTNGVFVTQLFPRLDMFTWIYVSLDECTVWRYEQTKGKAVFHRVCDNVRALLAQRDEVNAPTIGLGFLLHPLNWSDVPDMVRLAGHLGVDYCQFRPTVGLDDYSWIEPALDLIEHCQTCKVLFSPERFRDMLVWHRTYSQCRASEFVPCIGADGMLWVCPNTRGLRSLGNLRQHSFEEIWRQRPTQWVGQDCRLACRNHALNETLKTVCATGSHDNFV